MGANLSSPTFSAVTLLNKEVAPMGPLSPLVRLRQSIALVINRGTSPNMIGNMYMYGDARVIFGMALFLLNYNGVQHGKIASETMNNTIDKRHGYEQFKCMDRAEQARIKSYVRSEWFNGAYVVVVFFLLH